MAVPDYATQGVIASLQFQLDQLSVQESSLVDVGNSVIDLRIKSLFDSAFPKGHIFHEYLAQRVRSGLGVARRVQPLIVKLKRQLAEHRHEYSDEKHDKIARIIEDIEATYRDINELEKSASGSGSDAQPPLN